MFYFEIIRAIMEMKPSVYITCFAGRKHNMEILTRYIDHLIDIGSVDEFHMWDFTRNEDDAQYLESLENKKNYKLFKPKMKTEWSEYYLYYAQLTLKPNDVIIKLDDDILYIDTEQFDSFIHKRRMHTDNIIMFPNIINNGVCAHLQHKHNIMPFYLPYYSYSSLVSGRFAQEVHEYFVKNHKNVIQQAKKIHENYIVPLGHRVSINFMAILGKDIHHYNELIGDDEHHVSLIPLKHNKNHVIDLSMIVSHGAFSPQRDTGLDEQKLIKDYSLIMV
jgi:hypothetical protein